MRKSLPFVAIMFIVVAALSLTVAGCAKKPVPPPPPVAKSEPPPPPPPPPAAPTITLSASPSAVERGQSSVLRWSSSNAGSVSIDGGIGTVEASGSRSVSPTASTTYRARATGPGGSATAEARVTVTEPPAPPPPVRTITDAEFFATNVKDVFFDFDRYDIRDDARATLTANARSLKERMGINLLIEGHCDERGSEKYNLALGDRRANAAKNFLVDQGITAGRMDTISLGEERPFAEGHDETAWAQNRRAHFVLK